MDFCECVIELVFWDAIKELAGDDAIKVVGFERKWFCEVGLKKGNFFLLMFDNCVMLGVL